MSQNENESVITPVMAPVTVGQALRSGPAAKVVSSALNLKKLVWAAVASFLAHIVIWLVPPAFFVAGLFLAMGGGHGMSAAILKAGAWVIVAIPLLDLTIAAGLALGRKIELAVGILFGAASVIILLLIIPISNRFLVTTFLMYR